MNLKAISGKVTGVVNFKQLLGLDRMFDLKPEMVGQGVGGGQSRRTIKF